MKGFEGYAYQAEKSTMSSQMLLRLLSIDSKLQKHDANSAGLIISLQIRKMGSLKAIDPY